MRPALIIGLVIVVAVLIGLVAGLSIVIFRGDGATATANLAASPPVAPTSPVDPQITPPAASSPSAPMLPADAASTPAASPGIIEELRRARAASEAAAAAQAEAAAVEAGAAAEAANLLSEEIIQWLSRATVSGVRLSERENRVLLNGRAYTEGEFVNYTLGLKVLVIQETRILFVDPNDKKYMKRL
jgi:hypothetical protein